MRVSKLFPRETLFFTIAANIGDVGIADFETAATDSVIAISPHSGIEKRWLYHSLRWQKTTFEGLATQNAQANINLEKLRPYSLAVPPPPEQRAIAGALSDVDALIGAMDQLIAKKRDLKQAAMQELLTGKKRLPGFSRKWEAKRIGEMLCYERPDKYIVESTDYVVNGDIPVLTANKSFVLGFTNEAKGIHKDIPVIIFDDFTTDSKYVNFPFKIKSSAIKILKTRSNDVDLKYLFERMQLIKFSLGDHKRYYISEYQHLNVEVPEFEEQQVITQVLSDMDAEIEALEQKRDKYKAIKQGMMQELLTGKTRLV